MKRGLIASCLLATALLTPARAADAEFTPFQSVSVHDGAIVVTLPAAGPRWVIERDSSPSRLSERGEAFTLRAGAALRLTEKHSTFLFTAQLSPRAGLQVSSTLDDRSFGGTRTDKNYFIPAANKQ